MSAKFLLPMIFRNELSITLSNLWSHPVTDRRNKRRAYHYLTKYNYNKQNTEIFYKKWKKYNEIQLTKENGVEQSKNEKSSTLSRRQ